MSPGRYGHGEQRYSQVEWRKLSPVERFWIHVQRGAVEDCWTWLGNRGRKQYGLSSEVVTDSGTRQPHRISYELLIGPIAPGMHLDHLCRTPLCVNPRHLQPVTPLENTQRGLHGDLKSNCINHHILTPATARIRKSDNARICRLCDADRMRRARARVRDAA